MIRCLEWHGLDAVEFEKGDYIALLVPSVGANLVRLAHRPTGCELLRTPEPNQRDNFLARPHVYGLPVLFPPNRIAGAAFTFGGRTYRLPVTNPVEGCHHHGMLKSQPFQVSKATESDEEVLIEARWYSNRAQDVIHSYFPHDFKCKMIFRLSREGLRHEFVIFNRSDEPMPVGVGYHTPLRVPFEPDGRPEEYRLRLAAGEEWVLDEHYLPARRRPLAGRWAALREEGILPTGEAISAAFTASDLELDGRPFRGAVLSNVRTGRQLLYETDERTRYWTVWNNGGQEPWICPEPMSWITNAPNMRHLPDSETGFAVVEPGAAWSMRFRLGIR